MSLKKNLLYNLLYTSSQLVFPLITIPYISRVLLPGDVGRINFIDSLTYFFIAVAEFGLLVYGTRQVSKVKNDRAALKSLVSELLQLHLLTSLFAIIIYTITVFVLYERVGDTRLVAFSIIMLLMNSVACEWYFLGTEQFRFISTRLIVTRLAALAAMFIFVRQPSDYYIYYLLMVLAVCTNMVWNFVVLLKQVGISIRANRWFAHAAAGSVTFLISIFYGVPLFLDNVILGVTASLFAVGIYSFAFKIVRILGMAVTDSFMVFFPRIVDYLHHNKTTELAALHLKTTRIILLFCIPLATGLWLIADDVVSIIFGDAFYEVATDLKILAVFPLLKSYSLFLRNEILLPFAKEKQYLFSLMVGAVVFVLSSLLLCTYFGHVGACYALIISELVVIAISLHYSLKIAGIFPLPEGKIFLQTLAVCIFFVPLVYGIRQVTSENWTVIILSVIGCVTLYSIAQLYICKNPLAVEISSTIKKWL